MFIVFSVGFSLSFVYFYAADIHLFVGSYSIFFFLFFGSLVFFNIIYNFFTLNYLGYLGVFLLNWLTMFLFWVSLVYIYFFIGFQNIYLKVSLGDWFKVNLNFLVYAEFFFDTLSLSYTLLTVTIAVSVLAYTFVYFRYEPLVDRLLLLISAFVMSMVIFVNAANFIVLFLGWELIGLTSFLLINFWSTRVATLKAAFKAFIFNKFSDVALLIGIFLIYNEFQVTEINVFKNNLNLYVVHYYSFWTYQISTIEIISFFILVAAFIKSAQLGFHVWLPDSMEAPVPASALIHSATLVSAGVFLFLRLNQLFELSYYSYLILQIWGSCTAFYGGLCAVFQSDIKRLLAYSTISHCGFLMVCVTTEVFDFTLLYLYIHGFFKAAGFLCVGNIIRISNNYQDFRRMGGFFKFLPFEFFSLVLCLINLSGLPFSLGFFSKHILFTGLHSTSVMFWVVFLNCVLGAFCGFIYCFRLIYNVFFDFKKGRKFVYEHINNPRHVSFYYSNTSVLSNLAIFALIFNSYWIILYLFYFYLNSLNISKTLCESYYVNSQYYDLYFFNLLFLENLKIFNHNALILLALLCTLKYKPWKFQAQQLHVVIAYVSIFYFFFFFCFFFYNFL
jgi:NADH:ubiquinone oxidoreductase subunit 5 (subunit L)/multisubunit Na+/H+ antiporter MnhA subunit